MDTPTQSTRVLARRLLALESASKGATDAPVHEAVRVCEKLRIALTRLTGADGFQSLMRRALVLARPEVATLQSVTLKPDGSMEGLDLLSAEAAKREPEAALAISAHLLALLITFVGKPLTLQMVRETWPDASWED